MRISISGSKGQDHGIWKIRPDIQTKDTASQGFLKPPYSWALEPECRILVFMWSLGGAPHSHLNPKGMQNNGPKPLNVA